ncbi:3-oxoacyl-[acyl-carrier protein] reductase [Pontibacter ummariensis]|uniref:3-oxoacyl-[acyl-carrier protein] reductase n=1 Tax=Pontibacter ummariensis TaxID=1610492 RepID=A0A239GX07_9BACT|nr:SDR family oxidoreductase [Pontibacter ummariensis]PRY10992.1 3-oxoacyl-[acyl-carrier protein] reductase [Pontibacter ummariensis]SNS73471.1 3-oxoacyl-[acyl-carrier protein] reductase [Pontibacter ummariensis]
MNLNLENKRALVCGSTQGIGKATAIELAQLGASIVLVARNEAKLQEVANELDTSKGQQHDYIAADFSEPYELDLRVRTYLEQLEEVHILVNNTGGPPGGPITEAEPDEFLGAFNQHLICDHLLVQAVSPLMKKAGYGRIINIISTSVKQPLHGLGVSNTIRGAVASWAKTMANELGQYGITVNNVLPGSTRTGRLDSIIESRAQKSGTSVESIEEAMMAEIPARRFATPEEVAAAAAFLATPAAGYINGTSLPVDGGRIGCL